MNDATETVLHVKIQVKVTFNGKMKKSPCYLAKASGNLSEIFESQLMKISKKRTQLPLSPTWQKLQELSNNSYDRPTFHNLKWKLKGRKEPSYLFLRLGKNFRHWVIQKSLDGRSPTTSVGERTFDQQHC